MEHCNDTGASFLLALTSQDEADLQERVDVSSRLIEVEPEYFDFSPNLLDRAICINSLPKSPHNSRVGKDSERKALNMLNLRI